ncbi:MAG: M17 family metallopeptidase [Hyphomicrobiales bacterium]
MHIQVTKSPEIEKGCHVVFLVRDIESIPEKYISPEEKEWVQTQLESNKVRSFAFNRLSHWVFVEIPEPKDQEWERKEKCRLAAAKMFKTFEKYKINKIILADPKPNKDDILAFAEGLILGSYKFTELKTDSKKNENRLNELLIVSSAVNDQDLNILQIITEATCKARTLVNYPYSDLNATQLSNIAVDLAKETDMCYEVFDKAKIEELKMGGLLGVNKGSVDPPTFTILTYKPENAQNEKPFIFVGKGVVYDTGGVNIKTGNFMENMKCDMGGAAATICSIYAIAKAKLPVYVKAIVPATDNRPGLNAIVPGDVLRMHDGTTVEVLNTDAEGRLILADALAYAKQFDPQLVIDMATLTGSAIRAIGNKAIAAMPVKADEYYTDLEESGYEVYERLIKFPMWEEFGEQLKSDVADITNLGGPYAGQITAGKFLEHFTDYPYIHLDIAGPAFYSKPEGYFSAGGSGYCVRLLFDFINKKYSK